MSRSRFLLALTAIIAVGVALRAWPASVPDLPVEEYLKEGKELEQQGRYPKAIAYYSAALAKEPRNWDALTRRGTCEVATREIEKALSDLDDAVRFSKGKARDALVQRSFLYRMGGEFEKALADANRVIELNPQSALGYGIRAMAYEDPQKGDPARAKADYDKFVSMLTPEQRAKLLPGGKP